MIIMQQIKIKIIMPVFNDWDSFEKLAEKIYAYYNKLNYNIELIVINDCSDASFDKKNLNSFKINLINLLNNVGNQKAISFGIKYILKNFTDYDYIIIMDSDGEDKIEDIEKLILKCKSNEEKNIIFARRNKRYEGLLFKFFYWVYKKTFALLTGETLDFGNFSCIPKIHFNKVASLQDLDLHYSASVIKSRIPYKKLDCDKGMRIQGNTKIGLRKQLIHGLVSMSLFVDTIAVKIFFTSLTGIFFLGLFAIIIVLSKIIFNLAILGWTSTILMSTIIIFPILFLLCLFSLFLLLNNYNYNSFNTGNFSEHLIESIDILEKKIK